MCPQISDQTPPSSLLLQLLMPLLKLEAVLVMMLDQWQVRRPHQRRREAWKTAVLLQNLLASVIVKSEKRKWQTMQARTPPPHTPTFPSWGKKSTSPGRKAFCLSGSKENILPTFSASELSPPGMDVARKCWSLEDRRDNSVCVCVCVCVCVSVCCVCVCVCVCVRATGTATHTTYWSMGEILV